MLFFPYHTDAPIYYWPFVTLLMIVVNIFVFTAELANPEIVEEFSLAVGAGLHPVQWVTHNFLHADFWHLLGNMLSFWAFGLVVEGKIGPWKALAVYLGIGVFHGAIVQTLMLWHEPTICLGASAIIFGMMAISMIWAPENNMSCFLLVFVRVFFVEIPIKILVGIFVALQLLVLYSSGGGLSSEYLHTVGALLGFGVGIGILKTGHVDCEHWDIFSVWAGRNTMSDSERAARDAATPEGKKKAAALETRRQEKSLEEIRRAIREEQPIPALVLVKRAINENPRWMLPEEDLLLLIQSLSKQKHAKEAVETMRLYLTHYAAKADVVRIKLAQAYLEGNQPRTAMKSLEAVDLSALNTQQTAFYHALREKIKQAAMRNTYEMRDDS